MQDKTEETRKRIEDEDGNTILIGFGYIASALRNRDVSGLHMFLF